MINSSKIYVAATVLIIMIGIAIIILVSALEKNPEDFENIPETEGEFEFQGKQETPTGKAESLILEESGTLIEAIQDAERGNICYIATNPRRPSAPPSINCVPYNLEYLSLIEQFNQQQNEQNGGLESTVEQTEEGN